jgi:hypothetical protein
MRARPLHALRWQVPEVLTLVEGLPEKLGLEDAPGAGAVKMTQSK